MKNKKLPKKPSSRTKRKNQKKRPFLARSLRFLPAIVILGLSLLINVAPAASSAKTNKVLGYATSINISDLYSQTNAQRGNSGVTALSLNQKLINAAQAKANDMVARNYWSHNTPDGNPPWVFFTQAGYDYKAAGENLAYGFATSADTVTGWMNSPPHRDNLLNVNFVDVGFGIANSPDYVNDGPQTVVVAMYGAPAAVQPQTTPAPAPAATSSPPPVSTATPKPATAPVAAEPIQASPVEKPAPTNAEQPANNSSSDVQSAGDKKPVTAGVVRVRRIQLLTGGSASWSSTALVMGICALGVLWSLQRGFQIKRLVLVGERFITHHIHLDLTVLSILVLGWTMLQQSGVIR